MMIINWKPVLTALHRANCAPYHAGRFWIDGRFVADPVRVFYKHVTRLADSNVSVRELYDSFKSRATNYSSFEVHFLSDYVASIYTDLLPDDISLIIDTVAAMNDYKFFSLLISGLRTDRDVIVDTNDCIFDCVTAMRPDLSLHDREKYRRQTLSTIKRMLKIDNIPFVVFSTFPNTLPIGVICLTSAHAVVRLK